MRDAVSPYVYVGGSRGWPASRKYMHSCSGYFGCKGTLQDMQPPNWIN